MYQYQVRIRYSNAEGTHIHNTAICAASAEQAEYGVSLMRLCNDPSNTVISITAWLL